MATGGLILFLPIATNYPISFVDAIYTATSAICVTGLTVLDTASSFTTFGQMVILFLIQIGGIGYMSLVIIFFLFVSRTHINS